MVVSEKMWIFEFAIEVYVRLMSAIEGLKFLCSRDVESSVAESRQSHLKR
jgi:hypothetical protein